MASRVVLDLGNGYWKWLHFKTLSKWEQGRVYHAVATLTANEWNDHITRTGTGLPPEGVAKINGIPMAFGEMARRHTISVRPEGAGRLRREYYGAVGAWLLSEILGKSDPDVRLMCMYPPGDSMYVKNLVNSVEGQHQVISRNGEMLFDVSDVKTIDEPMAGLGHYLLNRDGTDRKRNPFSEFTFLMVDIGGYTIDAVPVDRGGKPDLQSADSTRGAGANNILEWFYDEIRRDNSTLFMDQRDMDWLRVEEALIREQLRFGKQVINVSPEARQAKAMLANEAIAFIRRMGGEANYDAVMLTGGGSALVLDYLKRQMPRMEFVPVDEEPNNLQMANVNGAAKSWLLLRKMKRQMA